MDIISKPRILGSASISAALYFYDNLVEGKLPYYSLVDAI